MDKEKLTQKVIAYKDGNNEAFNDIYEITRNNFFAYALFLAKNQNEAEELLQDSYMNILRGIDSLQDSESFTTWSKKIIHNTFVQKCRKTQKEFVCAEDEGELFNELEERDSAFLPGEEFDREEVRQIIIHIINRLPAEQKMAILSFYYDELTVKQIAEVMDCSEGTVKSRLFNGRKAIKEGIETYERDHDVRLHAAVPAGLIFAVLKDLDQVCRVPSSVSRRIMKSAAGLHPVQTGTEAVAKTAKAAKAAKAVSFSGMGAGKVISLVLVAALGVGGITYGVKHVASKPAEEPTKVEEPAVKEEKPDGQQVLDAYAAYFSEKVEELRAIEDEDENGIRTPMAHYVDENGDKIPEAIIFLTSYSGNHTVCTYVDGKIVELNGEGFVPKQAYYATETRISSDKKEIVLMIRDDSSTYAKAGRFQLKGDKYELIEEDSYDAYSDDAEKYEELDKTYTVAGGKAYGTGKDEPYSFRNVNDFIDFLNYNGIILGNPGIETDWKEAYSAYFGEFADQMYYDSHQPSSLAVHDVNGDGIPEIFLDEWMSENVFTFADGKVQAIEDPENNYGGSASSLYFNEDKGEIGCYSSTDTVGVPALYETFKITKKGFQITNRIEGYFNLTDEEMEDAPLALWNWEYVEVPEAMEAVESNDVYGCEVSDMVEIYSADDFRQFFEEQLGITLK